jgi:hypothetical protein
MDYETKTSTVRLGTLNLCNGLDFHEWLQIRCEIVQEAEAERRKDDPKYVRRWDSLTTGEMCEFEDGTYILYEDFTRIVAAMEKKISEAYNSGRNNPVAGYDRSTSWRD